MPRFLTANSRIVAGSLILGMYVEGAILHGFTVFVKPIVAEFAWSYVEVSIGISLLNLTMGIMAPIVGFIADRWGTGRLVLLGTLVGGFSLVALSRVSSIPTFYAGFVLLAVGLTSCGSNVFLTIIANRFDRDFGKVAGLLISGIAGGAMLVPAIGALISAYGWRATLLLLGLGLWVIGLPLSPVLQRKPRPDGLLAESSTAVTGNQLRLAVQGTRPHAEVGLGRALAERTFWQLTAASTAQVMGASAVSTHVVPYLTNVGTTETTAILVAGLIPMVSIAGRLGSGWLSDMLPPKWLMSGALAVTGSGLLIFSSAAIESLLWLFLVVFGVASGGAVTLWRSLLRAYFGRTAFGRLHGLSMALVMAGAAAGPALAGWAFDSTQTYQTIWIVFAGLLIVASALVWSLPNPSLGAGVGISEPNLDVP